ncbi:ABC-type Fe3+-hydroxamate transport system, periplasmic component [Rubellimicrobium thermophilum DSM 16684]|uniref:ABC-type Fe3+-hydroxamate transport system, periplasmic component n=1 Tax=Rubellimicrobium thermophilum DSM 16684 TaxID=1123069 RepID=S9QMT0_9RHOB|nr:iron-siderophore ABC transporter substrate-binding protein [Rubellimicrobium thermophilum]EPX82761.1 ABC-type Fe3+-hydroxamate transport system, periplasmic component [Rubellimicrobium thermophilum DSM 16684]
MLSRSLTAVLALVAAVPALAQDFPLTLETKFGPVTIEERPERVATLDFNGADNLLALGIQPVVIRHWYGDWPETVWPWAEEALTTQPVVIGSPIDIEAVAAADPDVIIGLWSGITEEEFRQLSLIAPVVAVPPGTGDYALPWEEQVRIMSRAVGRAEEAETQIADIEARIAGIRERHPDWQGRTATVAFFWGDRLGVYGPQDIRAQLLHRLGLETPQAVSEAVPPDAFSVDVSAERPDLIDADAVIWFTDQPQEALLALPIRAGMRAPSEGREIMADEMMASAFSHATLLSLPYALERLEPMIAAAIDGDPATAVPEQDL